MIKATAGAFLSANNFSINFSKLFIAKAELVILDCDEIIPESLSAGICTFLEKSLLNITCNTKC